MRSFILFVSLMASAAFGADNKDLEKRVEALEISSYTNTIQWSGFLETRFEEGTLKPSTGDTVKRSVNTMVGGLNFQSSLSDRVSIFGRVVYSSMYNGTFVDDSKASTFSEARSYQDAKVYFERFFANIRLLDNLQFTFGRLPTLDGPPFHFSDSLPRQGAYPKWIFPVAMDGYALTYGLKFDEGNSLAIRYIHSPFTYLVPSSSDFKYVPSTSTGVDSSGATASESNQDKGEAKSVMFDYNNSSSSFAKNLNVIVQGLMLPKLLSPPVPFLSVDYTHQLVYVEANGILNSGASAWLAYSMTDIKSSGYVGVVTPAGVGQISAMSNSPDGSAKGKGMALGVNYALPIAALKDPSLGGEYVKNDEKYVLFELNPRQMFDLYGIRGQATHIYWSQPVYDSIKLRVGTMMLNPTHAAGNYGEPKETDNKYSSIYANLRLDF